METPAAHHFTVDFKHRFETLRPRNMKSNPICRICNSGALQPKKVFRLSGPAVVIGYLLLIPSIIGILAGIGGVISASSVGSGIGDAFKNEHRARLLEAGIPIDIAEKAIEDRPLSETDRSVLTGVQIATIDGTARQIKGGQAGAGVASFAIGGIALGVAVASLIGGLIGWLLVMKKRVLKCSYCGAVVSAS